MFFQELKRFSRENWWIYVLLIIAITIVAITGRGNIAEIFILFFANFLGNLCIMVMQANYTKKSNNIGAIYHLSSTLIFTTIAIYGLIYFQQYQYIIWQLCYGIAAAKAFTFYNFGKDIKFFNEYTVGILNIVLLGIFIYFGFNSFEVVGNTIQFNVSFGSICMALGFSFVTTGLVSTKDNFRYWTNLLGILGIVLGSAYLVIASYMNGVIDGIGLGYLILTLTTFVFYIKLLPSYIQKLKK